MQDPKSWTKDTQEDAVENQDTSLLQFEDLEGLLPLALDFLLCRRTAPAALGGITVSSSGAYLAFPHRGGGTLGLHGRHCPQVQGRSGLFLPHFEVLENSQELLE